MAENEFFQDGIRYVPSTVAAKRVGFSPDYISRFCRQGAVTATWHQGKWWVNEASLDALLATQARQQQEPNRKLSEEAREEAEHARASEPVQSALVPVYRSAVVGKRASRTVSATAIATITLVVSLTGVLALAGDDVLARLNEHVASARASLTRNIGATHEVAQAQSAATGASGFAQWIGELLFSLFGDEPQPTLPAPPPSQPPQLSQTDQTTTSPFVKSAPSLVVSQFEFAGP